MLEAEDTLTVLEVSPNDGLAIIVDDGGNRYELHTDECHAQRFEEAQDVCGRLVELAEMQRTTLPAPFVKMIELAKRAVFY